MQSPNGDETSVLMNLVTSEPESPAGKTKPQQQSGGTHEVACSALSLVPHTNVKCSITPQYHMVKLFVYLYTR